MASSGGHSGVYVSSLTLTDFRCYQSTRLTLKGDHPMVVLVGPNGAGKTNVLEALSYLAPGRGLRGAPLGEVTRQAAAGAGRTGGGTGGGKNGWAVAAALDLAGEDVKVGTGLDAGDDSATARRLVRVDGDNKTSTNALGERWSVTWLTPQMDRLFLEGPSARRRFLDRLTLGLYPDHSRQVGAYERVMRERNRLLGDRGAGADPAWLTALEARMADHAVAVAIARLDFAGQLAGRLESADDGPFPKALLAIDGWLEGEIADGLAAVEAEAALRDRLASNRRRDAAAGRALEGVHKTDLVVTHAPKEMRADLCSTGEQKALLIALVLANAKLQAAQKGMAPLMLMDEVAAHLDAHRREALFEALAGLGSQCWLTGTDRGLFEALEGRAEFYTVEGGEIRPPHA
jgi:DNA replication and repair protein RecF